MTKTKTIASLAAAACAVALSTPAAATVEIYSSPGVIQPDENVLYKPSNTPPATTAFGTTNQTDTSITFTSTEPLQTPPNGQALIENVDGVINNLNFFATDPTLGFNEVELNLFGGPGTTATGGTLTFTDQFGMDFSTAVTINNGQNFYSAEALHGQVIKNVSFVLNGDIADVRQVRVGIANIPAVPEPKTWAMMLIGFGAVGYSMRRRPNQRFAQAF